MCDVHAERITLHLMNKKKKKNEYKVVIFVLYSCSRVYLRCRRHYCHRYRKSSCYYLLLLHARCDMILLFTTYGIISTKTAIAGSLRNWLYIHINGKLVRALHIRTQQL